jgi:SAM-dependent methyltransferase
VYLRNSKTADMRGATEHRKRSPESRAASSSTPPSTTTVPLRVLLGVADGLPLADASVDAAVTSRVLGSVPDQPRALAEIHRVLKPEGDLRLYEHVIPNYQPRRALLQIADYSHALQAVATPPATPRRRSSSRIRHPGTVNESCSPRPASTQDPLRHRHRPKG